MPARADAPLLVRKQLLLSPPRPVSCSGVTLGSADAVRSYLRAMWAEMSEKRDMMIHMDPHMAAKFEASTHVSRKYTFEFGLL